MASINGFRIDLIVDLILSGDAKMDADELFGRIRAEPPLPDMTKQRTLNDLYRVISDNW